MARRGRAEGKDDSERAPARRAPPLDINLSLKVKLGPGLEEQVTLIRDRRLRIAGSILSQRDRILRGLVTLLIQLGTTPPRKLRRQWQGRRG